VSDAKPDLSRLSELAGGLGLHEHLCLIYETQEEQFAAALPFLRAGLERGERCLYIADANSGATVLDGLRKGGVEVDRHLRNGALIVAGNKRPILATDASIRIYRSIFCPKRQMRQVTASFLD
jgi:hypothetical protein